MSSRWQRSQRIWTPAATNLSGMTGWSNWKTSWRYDLRASGTQSLLGIDVGTHWTHHSRGQDI